LVDASTENVFLEGSNLAKRQVEIARSDEQATESQSRAQTMRNNFQGRVMGLSGFL
tara:strand:+ start:339 stop:506 length:168 start_codon:yes stop_codon:yes gene_type:complete